MKPTSPADLRPGARRCLSLDRYAVDDLGSPKMQRLLDEWHRAYTRDGMCIVPDFVRPDEIDTLVNEVAQVMPLKYRQEIEGNAYLVAANEEAAEHHPLRMTEKTRTSTIACDQISPDAAIRQIYDSPAIDSLVAQIVGAPAIYHYECPMGAVNISVMEEDDYLRWHFDQSEFVVSIHLQDSESGGHYEYVRDLRSDDDPNFDEVSSVLRGDRSKVASLETTPGALLVFRGKNTLHRVTPVRGNRARLVLLYGYALEPGVKSSDYLLQMRYGRTTTADP